MMRASGLRGLAVVDLEVAVKLGQVDEVVLDPDSQMIAGLVVSQGRSIFGGRDRTMVHASAVHAIGPDVLTVHHTGRMEMSRETFLPSLPRLSALVGRTMVTQGGRVLGSIADVLIDGTTRRILGYAIDAAGPGGHVQRLFSPPREDEPAYVRADADLRFGEDLIVVPDDAVVRPGRDVDRPEPAASDSVHDDRAAANLGWGNPDPAGVGRIWIGGTRSDSGHPATSDRTAQWDRAQDRGDRESVLLPDPVPTGAISALSREPIPAPQDDAASDRDLGVAATRRTEPSPIVSSPVEPVDEPPSDPDVEVTQRLDPSHPATPSAPTVGREPDLDRTVRIPRATSPDVNH